MQMLRMPRLLLALAALFLIAATPPRYAEGQVWSYKHRAGEESSLLKIQKIESAANETVFHISVKGFRLRNPSIVPMLPHAPVSQQTLDASVVSLQPDPGNFPPVQEGIAQWRKDNGGVFSIPVSQIIQVLDDTTSENAGGVDANAPLPPGRR